jgi:hypothetical protein
MVFLLSTSYIPVIVNIVVLQGYVIDFLSSLGIYPIFHNCECIYILSRSAFNQRINVYAWNFE